MDRRICGDRSHGGDDAAGGGVEADAGEVLCFRRYSQFLPAVSAERHTGRKMHCQAFVGSSESTCPAEKKSDHNECLPSQVVDQTLDVGPQRKRSSAVCLQIQGSPGYPMRYRNMADAFQVIVREEGPRALWRGSLFSYMKVRTALGPAAGGP